MSETIKIKNIRTDGGTQPRAQLDAFVVSDYTEAMERGDPFPPVRVVYDGEDYWLWDGFHRLKAAEKIARETIEAEVSTGTHQDAVWKSLAANKSHGLRRTRADKKRAVIRALEGWGESESARAIARHVGVSQVTVLKYHEEVFKVNTSSQKDNSRGRGGRVQGADGKWYPSKQKPQHPKLPDSIVEAVKDTHVADDLSEQRELAKLPAQDQLQVADLLRSAGMSVKDAVDLKSLPKKERSETLKLVRDGVAPNVRKAKQKLKERRLKEKLKEQNTTAKELAVIYPETCETFCRRIEKVGKADLLLTDPPYRTEFKAQDEFESFVSTWVIQSMTALKSSARAYVFVGAYPNELCLYLNTFQDFVSIVAPGWTIDNILPWTYRNTLGPAPKMGYKLNWQACIYLYGPDANSLNAPKMTEQFTVQDINAPDGRIGDRFHTFQKPDTLAERLIRHSTKEGDLVIDPFAGTGTFPLAAARLGRTAFGSEPDKKMLGICRERGAKIGGEVDDA